MGEGGERVLSLLMMVSDVGLRWIGVCGFAFVVGLTVDDVVFCVYVSQRCTWQGSNSGNPFTDW